MDGATTPDAVLERILESWNLHDMEAFGSLFAVDSDFVNIFGDWWKGRARIVQEHASRHRNVFRSSRFISGATEARFLGADVALVRSRSSIRTETRCRIAQVCFCLSCSETTALGSLSRPRTPRHLSADWVRTTEWPAQPA